MILIMLIGIIGSIRTADVRKAVCTLETTSHSEQKITGNVYFEQTGTSTRVYGEISGLKEGEHGFHIHYYGDISLASGSRVGPHFNIDNDNTHGKPPDSNRHIGDMGTITADSEGKAKIDSTGHLWTLDGNLNTTIIGRSLIIHELADDGSEPQGNAGRYFAQCTIGIQYVDKNTDSNIATFGTQLDPKFASCELHGTPSYSGIAGRILFQKVDGGLEVKARVCGLPDGKHGFHIHEFGDHSDKEESTLLGDHWNPNGGTHGLRSDPNRHAGDLGNVETTASKGDYTDTNGLIQLDGINSILGRSMVVHIMEDSGVEGSYGAKAASCVIGLSDRQNSIDDVCTKRASSEDTARRIVFFVALAPVMGIFLCALIVLVLL